MIQAPAPGSRLLRHAGDIISFSLTLERPASGTAWLRTNLGHAEQAREEIIEQAVSGRTRPDEDWHDLPMRSEDGRVFRLTLPLFEPGRFQAKAFFLPDNESVPLWPDGTNTVIHVEPAHTACANTLYNAFVRQFGASKKHAQPLSGRLAEAIDELDEAGYTIIPPSGGFRDLIQEMDFIVGKLRCRMVMLLPIHPVPSIFARMGRFGSPYAALDFFQVDPGLAEFDKKATPTDQFVELADAVHSRGACLLLDIAINHTGWASAIHRHHPEWLKREPDGSIRSPGAWGVTWSDLTELDHSLPEVRQYFAEVFLSWCRLGADGFRCDAGYMIPCAAWEYITARVRREFPNTIFLLEGLGGDLRVTRDLLDRANLNMAYSELFQNYSRSEVEANLRLNFDIANSDGMIINFAETHDNNRLAARSPLFAKLRSALCALSSTNGAFAFANGVEWYATEKIDVHESRSLNWGARPNQVAHLARLNSILASHPAFHNHAETKLVTHGEGTAIVLYRTHPPSGSKALVLVNLNDEKPSKASWLLDQADLGTSTPTDLIKGRPVPITVKDGICSCKLKPGEALCLASKAEDMANALAFESSPTARFTKIEHQRLRAKALEALACRCPTSDFSSIDPDDLASKLSSDPALFCKNILPDQEDPRVTEWRWPEDQRREVMIPPGHFLLVRASRHFIATLSANGRTMGRENSFHHEQAPFALFKPHLTDQALRATMAITVFDQPKTIRGKGAIIFLPQAEQGRVKRIFSPLEADRPHPLALAGNGRGAMLRASSAWGELRSRYDALLAGNLHPSVPDDRRMMLARCRAWLVYRGYSEELNLAKLIDFTQGRNNAIRWRFRVSFGQAFVTCLEVIASMPHEKNAVRLLFTRTPMDSPGNRLKNNDDLRLILRPDIEDRSFHEVTKAFAGPEKNWPAAITPQLRGFMFRPAPERTLKLSASSGAFTHEPEWRYMVGRALETERGLDPDSDLFSPGYLAIPLRAGQTAELLAQITTPQEPKELDFLPLNGPAMNELRQDSNFPEYEPILDTLERALRHFVVRRGNLKTVIAGYPWFLDWGRDTLICARGLIAAGMHEEVMAILRQFAQFEQNGTLPNMIRGDDASNRNTSDAPLWFFTACADLTKALKRADWLDESAGGRPVRDALLSIARSCSRVTPNGIAMDPATGLLFSPSHFTWMDTNFPAATPRRGYPVEIQALWHAALRFLTDLGETEHWESLAELVARSVNSLYPLPGRGYLSDCLHGEPAAGAAKAQPDDALRPNQLFAITLGTIQDIQLAKSILAACSKLLVPGAIRSLADLPVEYPLPVHRDGVLLNDPSKPYWGAYRGDEDTRRKPAYHNGTAWTWPFPSYCEAFAMTYGEAGKSTAIALLESCRDMLCSGCIGQLPEIIDGDAPHHHRGCDAQAWGATEFYRVLRSIITPTP